MTDIFDEHKKNHPEAHDDTGLNALNDEADIAEQLAMFANSASGKQTIQKLQRAVYSGINELFAISREPELAKLLGAIARLEANMQMLAKFVQAPNDAETLSKTLAEVLKTKTENA